MKKLYLDVCTLCRPFDNQDNMRIRLETDAYYLMLNKIQKNIYQMIVSPMHFKKVESIEDAREKILILQFLDVYGKEPKYNLKKPGKEQMN